MRLPIELQENHQFHCPSISKFDFMVITDYALTLKLLKLEAIFLTRMKVYKEK